MRRLILVILALLLIGSGALASSGEEGKAMWELTFEDTFDGTQVDPAKWCFELGTGTDEGLTQWGNNEQQYYQAENAVVSDGMLTVYARREISHGLPYTSARLCTRELFSQCFGRFEARMRLPKGEGFWPAFWLMPQDNAYGIWAASGEIDIMEARGRLPGQILNTLHYGAAWPDNVHTGATVLLPRGTEDDFHTYALEWEAGEMRWYIDDVLTAAQKDWYSQGNPYPAPFDQPFYILLNLAVGGNFDDNRMPGSLGGPLEGKLEVDYVRVYQKKDQ